MAVVTACAGLLAVAAASGVDAEPPPAHDAAHAALHDFEERVRRALPVPGPRWGGVAAGLGAVDAGRGPVTVYVPTSYDPETPVPLIILLHGYMNTGQDVEDWMQLSTVVDEYGFLLLHPTGTTDFIGNPFWNATNACCDLFGSNPDDSAYLRNLIEAVRDTYAVDDRRIHFVGHSNGGFMSYRMACDHADVVASIVSLAGATWLDPGDCSPTDPVHTLQIHGTSDGVIDDDGGCIPLGGCYPGAVGTAERWAASNGCAVVGVPQPEMLDIDANIAGSETTVVRYDDGCDAGGSAELWTIPGGPHSPRLSSDFRHLVVQFLLDHPKPAACPADLDGSGAVDVSDLLALLAAWGACPACPEDLDDDGAVGVTDLLELLGVWGSCT